MKHVLYKYIHKWYTGNIYIIYCIWNQKTLEWFLVKLLPSAVCPPGFLVPHSRHEFSQSEDHGRTGGFSVAAGPVVEWLTTRLGSGFNTNLWIWDIELMEADFLLWTFNYVECIQWSLLNVKKGSWVDWFHQVTFQRALLPQILSHTIHVYGKCKEIYHTWMLWCIVVNTWKSGHLT